MGEPVTGSVELHNARMYITMPKRIAKIKVDEFPKWLVIPRSVIDPRDWKQLYKIVRSTKPKERPGITIRVLRNWYEMKVKAFEAIENGDQVTQVPEKVYAEGRERYHRVVGGRAKHPWNGPNVTYMKGQT